MKGYLVYFEWDFVGVYSGWLNSGRFHDSYYWVPVSVYNETQLASVIGHLTGGNTWVKIDEGEYPHVNKRSIRVFSYRVEEVELCEKTTQTITLPSTKTSLPLS